MATTFRDKRAEGVEFTYEDDLITAIDIETGVAGCGFTRHEALAELADALALHDGEGEPIEDEAAFLRELDIDPDECETAETPPWLE